MIYPAEYLAEELPSSYADRLALEYTLSVSADHKKKLGQFFTPLSIAKFMSGFFKTKSKKIRILDPGCGTGTLACSIVEFIVESKFPVEVIELIVFESDTTILPFTDKVINYLREWSNKNGILLNPLLCKNDFILHNSSLLSGSKTEEFYDVVIANPPYFKLKKTDPRVLAAKSITYGQTNIYSIFLIMAAKLLENNGRLIFITPRSFASGSYFRLFREVFFSLIDIKKIHLFDSRKEAFKRDKILQENIIVVGDKKQSNLKNQQLKLPYIDSSYSNTLTISVSKNSKNLSNSRRKTYQFENLVNLDSYQKILHIPSSTKDEMIINLFKSWTHTLESYGIKISTGPVVAFRSLKFISHKKDKNHIPLIWLHNVGKMTFEWPGKNLQKGQGKGQYIRKCDDSLSRLIPNRNYLLLRRFSSKEDLSRLVSTPYLKTYLPKYSHIGVENHVNYIYKDNRDFEQSEIFGLATLLNSKLFDLYFRTFNGNINVSATELRNMPLPDLQIIRKIGEKVMHKNEFNKEINYIVYQSFNIDLN